MSYDKRHSGQFDRQAAATATRRPKTHPPIARGFLHYTMKTEDYCNVATTTATKKKPPPQFRCTCQVVDLWTLMTVITVKLITNRLVLDFVLS